MVTPGIGHIAPHFSFGLSATGGRLHKVFTKRNAELHVKISEITRYQRKHCLEILGKVQVRQCSPYDHMKTGKMPLP